MKREYLGAVELSTSVVFGVVAGWVIAKHVQSRALKALLPALGAVIGFFAGLARLARGAAEGEEGRG